MGPRFLDFSKGGKQTPLGLPGSGLSYGSSRRPWGHIRFDDFEIGNVGPDTRRSNR
jgi:hypothetical protein